MAQFAHLFSGFVGAITFATMIGSDADAFPVKPHGHSVEPAAQAITLYSSDPYLELQKLLRPHFYFGGRVSDAVRAATGDPNITVIDRRWKTGEIYECNFEFWGARKQRVMVCD
ncbi:MAG: hypothetical protein AAF362_14160 [Pseudomonadota bacterium]